MFKNRKNRIIALVILILFIIILFLCFSFHSAKSNYCYELEKMQTEGIPLTPELYAAKYYKAIPENENAYKIFAKTFSKLEEPSFPSLLIFEGQAQSPWLDQKLSLDLMKYAREYLQKNNEAFSEIEKVMEYSYLRFPYNWSKGFGRKMIPANNIRKIIYLYAIQIEIAIYDGNHTKAKQYLKNMFHITNLIKQEPTLLAQVVSQFCTSVTINCLERCMNTCSLSPEELKFFIKKCSDDEKYFCSHWALGWQDEMVMVADLASPARIRAVGLFDYKENDINKKLLSAQYDFISGNMYRTITKVLNKAREVMKTPIFPYLKNIKKLSSIATEYSNFNVIGISISVLDKCDKVYIKLIKTIAQLRCARTACAIKLYKQKYGYMPDKLNCLVPEFFKNIPLDPFTGKVLNYAYGQCKVSFRLPVVNPHNLKLIYKDTISDKDVFYIFSSDTSNKFSPNKPLSKINPRDGIVYTAIDN